MSALVRRSLPTAVAVLLFLASAVSADIVSEWDAKACAIVLDTKLPTAATVRMLAITETAVYEAVNAITARYPASAMNVSRSPGASVDAAVAAATRATLVAVLPAQKAAIEEAYAASLAKIADGAAKTDGLAVGERAAAAVMAARAEDVAPMGDTYRPRTAPGVYVPTVTPIAQRWPECKPWLLSRADQFRPAPPPKLTSKIWARDYNESKALGGKQSAARTPEQTEIARFWEATGPSIYHGIVRSVADSPGRDVTQNARLYAAVCQTAQDALIAVFDAKYHYEFWRPVTAIRNGDRDLNSGTARDSAWVPFIETPMHPEYPCAHCILSGAIGTVLQAEIGSGPMPTLTTSSPTANGATRSWTSIEAFMQEVANARIYDGVHYRNSTEVGTAMGKKIGALAASKLLAAPK